MCDKTFNIATNPKYDGYKHELASMVYKFFDKKSAFLADKSTTVEQVINEDIPSKELTEKLHKPVIKNFKKRNCRTE